MYSKLSTKYIYEQQEEEILNNLVLVSLTRTIRMIRHTGILSSTGV